MTLAIVLLATFSPSLLSSGANANTLSEKEKMRMCSHTVVANAVVAAACTLAIALLTIGMGVNSTWAGSDQPNKLSQRPRLVQQTCVVGQFLCSCQPARDFPNFSCCASVSQQCACCGPSHERATCLIAGVPPMAGCIKN
jgi:hypothetical protein